MNKQMILQAAKQYGTPSYLYDGEAIITAYQRLRKLASPHIDIFFSMKANPLLGICQLLRREGACCEVCSEAELSVALKAGFQPSQIIFVGPGKTEQECRLCVEHNIYAIVCESIEEVLLVDRLARTSGHPMSVLLRINPSFSIKNAPLKMGGTPTQFGIDLEVVYSNQNTIQSCRSIRLLGIHIYNGSRLLDADAVIENTRHILQLANKLAAEWSLPFSCIDIGGGFGVPYFSDEHPLDVEKIFTALNPLFKVESQRHGSVRFILECGRYLVSEAGQMIGRVLSTKISHGESFVINDAGMNCHLAATGIGSYMKRNFPINVLKASENTSDEQQTYTITGPLCTPGDVIARQVTLPSVAVGDYIIMNHAGAYGPTASPTGFLSHGYPAEILFYKNQFHVLRPRQSKAAILETQMGISLAAYPECNECIQDAN